MRYKGSKAWLAPLMERLLPDVQTLVSPFLGSGKVELALLRRGVRVQGSTPGGRWSRCTKRRWRARRSWPRA
jgi:hypothetical protein